MSSYNHFLIMHKYRNFNVKLKNLQTTQNKCIRVCLNLNKMRHIAEEDLKTILLSAC